MSESTTHHVPASSVMQLVSLVQRWKVSADALLAGFDVTEAGLAVADAQVPLDVALRIMERARALTAEPGLGFYLGLQCYADACGRYIGSEANFASMRELLELAVDRLSKKTGVVNLELCTQETEASIEIHFGADLGTGNDIMLFAFLVSLQRLWLDALGPAAPELTIDVPVARPAYFERFVQLLPAVRFTQEKACVRFDRAILETAPVVQEPGVDRIVQEACERTLQELGFERQLPARVRRIAVTPEGFRSIEEVARDLNLSTRTLKRRLAAEGVTFSSLLDHERYQRAIELIRATDLTLEQIARRLHYSSLTNFARAFRRWTGETPGQYRRSLG